MHFTIITYERIKTQKALIGIYQIKVYTKIKHDKG